MLHSFFELKFLSISNKNNNKMNGIRVNHFSSSSAILLLNYFSKLNRNNSPPNIDDRLPFAVCRFKFLLFFCNWNLNYRYD